MKELSIEEKAKAYDEIREKANKMHYENCEACQMCIEELIPELKESEDDKIRKAIINEISLLEKESVIEQEKNVYQSWIAWLEKKELRKLKFRVGDEIKTVNEAPLTITRIDRFGYWSDDLFICSFENSVKWELVEKLVDKTEPLKNSVTSYLKR